MKQAKKAEKKEAKKMLKEGLLAEGGRLEESVLNALDENIQDRM